jgi:hypothetical protein
MNAMRTCLEHGPGIVADGRCRAYRASVRELRPVVELEFAERLRAAGFWRRIVIRLAMRAEIRRRARRLAPLDGLYWRG